MVARRSIFFMGMSNGRGMRAGILIRRTEYAEITNQRQYPLNGVQTKWQQGSAQRQRAVFRLFRPRNRPCCCQHGENDRKSKRRGEDVAWAAEVIARLRQKARRTSSLVGTLFPAEVSQPEINPCLFERCAQLFELSDRSPRRPICLRTISGCASGSPSFGSTTRLWLDCL